MKTTRYRHISFAFLLAVFALLWQGGSPDSAKAQNIDFSRLNANLTDNFVLPHYAFLASSAERLAGETAEFCKSPSQGALRLLQDQFNQSMDTFTEISHIRFGRIAVDNRYKRLYFWPDPDKKVEKALREYFTNKNTGDEEKDISDMPAEMQGYVTLGHLIFGKSAEVILKNEDEGKKRCALSIRITKNIAAITQQVFTEWREGPAAYAGLIKNAGSADNPEYDTANKATIAYLDSIVNMLDEIANKKLPLLLGAPYEAGEPKRAECWCSGRSVKNIQINLRVLLEMYRGVEDFGFDDILLSNGQGWLFNDIASAFEHAILLAGSISSGNEQILKDEKIRNNLQKLRLQIKKLHSLFVRDLKSVIQ